jgi:hypothetical protein
MYFIAFLVVEQYIYRPPLQRIGLLKCLPCSGPFFLNASLAAEQFIFMPPLQNINLF